MLTKYQTQNLVNTWNNANRSVLHELTEDDIINVEGEIDLYEISDGWKAISTTDRTLEVTFGVCASFKASHMNLSSMVGCPKIVTDKFIVSHNNIRTLEGLPLNARVVDLRNNPIESFEGIGNLRDCQEIWVPCSITSNMLGLLKIKTLKKLFFDANFNVNSSEFHAAFKIIKYHFDNGRNLLACQEELIDAGLKDYAEF